MSDVIGADGAQRAAGADDAVVTFSVPSVDDAVAALRGRGVDFVTDAHDQDAWMIRVAHFRDPEGHLIEINAPIRPSE